MLSDIEMVCACAIAMGLDVCHNDTGVLVAAKNPSHPRTVYSWTGYNPLTNDEQAMEMVKKFHIMLQPIYQASAGTFVGWGAIHDDNNVCVGMDLNRCICECVANIARERGEGAK